MMYRRVSVEIEGEKPISCASPSDLALHAGSYAVMQAQGGQEFVKIVDWKDVDDEMPTKPCIPKLLRQATLQDQAKADDNNVRSKMARETCTTLATKQNIHLHLLQIRYNFDRSLLHIILTAEQNIDTNAFVTALSTELHTRIDIQQIGVRDEAGLVGGIGPCGRNLCCCTWLNHFESINVKMAKTQRISLNPSTMSGMCGRLKCCLRYEHEAYREMSRNLPLNGKTVETSDGKGIVLGTDIMAQTVRVQLDDDRIIVYGVDDVRECWGRGSTSRSSDHEDSSHQRPKSGNPRQARTRPVRKHEAG